MCPCYLLLVIFYFYFRHTSVTVNINVLVNIHKPEFNPVEYNITVLENVAIGTHIVYVKVFIFPSILTF
jgi:hypothetical protein